MSPHGLARRTPRCRGISHERCGDAEHLGEFTSPEDYAFEKQMRLIVDAVESVVLQMASATLPHIENEHRSAGRHFLADVPDTLQDFKERIIPRCISAMRKS